MVGQVVIAAAIIVMVVLIIKAIKNNWSTITHVVGVVSVIALSIWAISTYWPTDRDVKKAVKEYQKTAEKTDSSLKSWWSSVSKLTK